MIRAITILAAVVTLPVSTESASAFTSQTRPHVDGLRFMDYTDDDCMVFANTAYRGGASPARS